MAAHQAVFGFLCVLDGVSAIEAVPPSGMFDLRYRQGETEVRLTEGGEDLHDLYPDILRSMFGLNAP
jgi:hypothetical protein